MGGGASDGACEGGGGRAVPVASLDDGVPGHRGEGVPEVQAHEDCARAGTGHGGQQPVQVAGAIGLEAELVGAGGAAEGAVQFLGGGATG